MKKILSLILAALMTASCAAFVAADDAAEVVDAAVETTDAAVEVAELDETQVYAVEFLKNYKIYQGNGEDMEDDLNANVERWHMALFVSRLSTGWVEDRQWEDGTDNASQFDDIDVEPVNKVLGALSYANQKGIIEGYSATKFAPRDGITYRDALTMVCRTLGYKGLAYPWGYIQQAVELGLTDDAIDAAYTDNLTRGEVAVILYNALFAEMKAGGTLAKSIFDVDFAWENIVIVSTDEADFNIDEVVTAASEVKADAGYVGFKILDAEGKLSKKTYYVASEDFGFENREEEYIGHIFYALFESTNKTDLVKLLDYTALDTVIVNNGITDNAGETKNPLPIYDYLTTAGYKLIEDKKAVSGYDKYLAYNVDEVKIFGSTVVDFIGTDGDRIGVDIVTGNLLALNDKDEWEVAWWYSQQLDKYYRYYYDDAAKQTGDDAEKAFGLNNSVLSDAFTSTTVAHSLIANIVIDWMSDEEFKEWYNDAIQYVERKDGAIMYSLKTLAGIKDDPYAELTLFDTDKDDMGEVGLYKSYRIGYFSTTTKKCTTKTSALDHSAGKDMPAYKLTDMDESTTIYYEFVEEGHEAHDPNYASGVKAGNGFAWITVADDVVGFETETGYNNGVVVYNVNSVTGQIDIVKYIPAAGEGMDEDSFIVEGILQAYSTLNRKITVDGVNYDYGYANLLGVAEAMKKDDGTQAGKKLASAVLDNMLMQYVKIVVCDGLVVDIDLVGEDTDAVIVVVDYAGVTSDGYIAVYGYSTASADAKLQLFKINSYNGWKQGDYRYNPWNAANDEAFEFGTIYEIKSHDTATDSYGVYTYDAYEYAQEVAKTDYINISFEDGYRLETSITKALADYDKTAPSIVAQKATDKYILIHTTQPVVGATANQNYFNGFVTVSNGYDMDEDDEITGKKLYGSNDSGVYVIFVDTTVDFAELVFVDDSDADNVVIYAATKVLGDDKAEDLGLKAGKYTVNDTVADFPYERLSGDFANPISSDIGFILYDKDISRVYEASYDDAQALVNGYYLLGAVTSKFSALNLLTGKFDTYISAQNVDLEDGNVYMTVNGVVTGVVYENILEDVFTNNPNTVTNGTSNFLDFMEDLADYFPAYDGASLADLDRAGYIVVADSSNATTAASAEIVHEFSATTKLELQLMIAEDLGVLNGISTAGVKEAIAKKYVNADNMFIYKVTDDEELIEVGGAYALEANKNYDAVILYNAKTGASVVYILGYVDAITGSTTVVEAPKAFGDSETYLYEALYKVLTDANLGIDFNQNIVADWAGKYVTEEFIDDDAELGAVNKSAVINSITVGWNVEVVDEANEGKKYTGTAPVFGTADHFGKANPSHAIVNYYDNEEEEWVVGERLDYDKITLDANGVTVSGLNIELPEDQNGARIKITIDGDKYDAILELYLQYVGDVVVATTTLTNLAPQA